MSTKKFKCTSCGKTSDRIGVTSMCRQTFHIGSDSYTDLDVGETLHGFCLECSAEIPADQLKKLTGLKDLAPDYRSLLTNLLNSYLNRLSVGIERKPSVSRTKADHAYDTAVTSLEALNKARVALGLKPL